MIQECYKRHEQQQEMIQDSIIDRYNCRLESYKRQGHLKGMIQEIYKRQGQVQERIQDSRKRQGQLQKMIQDSLKSHGQLQKIIQESYKKKAGTTAGNYSG
jgi:hypothetical protein